MVVTRTEYNSEAAGAIRADILSNGYFVSTVNLSLRDPLLGTIDSMLRQHVRATRLTLKSGWKSKWITTIT